MADLIQKEVGYFNGWSVPYKTVEKDCKIAAENIYRYLKQGRHLVSNAADEESRAVLEGVDYIVNNVDCDTISLTRR